MNKKEFVAAVAENAGMTKKDAAVAVQAVVETISDALVAGEDVSLVGFGKFYTAARSARQGRNPQTGEAISIPSSMAPKFKAGKALKERVNA